jgi:hypothetical protein
MTVYGAIVFVHVVCAVVGMGPAFVFPLIMKFAKTKEQLVFVNGLLEKAEKGIKLSSILLLISGFIMGFLNTSLFQEIWYIASIVLYVVAQFFVIGVGAKNTKKVVSILEQSEGNEIPSEVNLLNSKIIKAHYAASIIAVIMVFLMSIKPF